MAMATQDEFDIFGDRPSSISKRPPVGYSVASACSAERKKILADRAAGDDADDADKDDNLPFELQPHSYDKIEVKDFRGIDGPWFCYAWVDKRNSSAAKFTQ
eukprot:gnl/TRDRNA2_/TRDRNA2_58044_c0_seq1.p1 gnl/TRDRNA2_/TRDRNA2_58044_c0~~gnl/TRDRNA2_/TRDRNA2_58044_c0_seq1.p1  ORF type:complete len:102 (-),score=31.29 gnl/TRDRNA2_/TRDRNA2_58044_c0_seq1:74-379(-)